MAPTVTVKSSPNAASVDLFVLHEGTKVTVLESSDGWNKVRIANGSVGWLEVDKMLSF
jgi:SH3-like domain-containing protein